MIKFDQRYAKPNEISISGESRLKHPTSKRFMVSSKGRLNEETESARGVLRALIL